MNNLKIVNIYNSKKTIYLFCREDNGSLKIITDNSFAPYFYECVDVETEALTKNGWKDFKNITVKDEIATFDFLKEEIIYHKPYQIHKYKYDGKMINIKTPYFNQLITPNHKILYRYIHKNKSNNFLWNFIEAQQLFKYKGLRQIQFPVAGVYNGEQSVGMDKIKLLGWIITEGCKKYKGINIKQSMLANKKNVLEIKKVLNNLKIKYTLHTWHGMSTFYLPSNNQELNWIFDLINFKNNKTPSDKLLYLNHNELKNLFDTLIKGDGHIYSKNSIGFYQKNKKTIKWFKTLCCLLGYRTKESKNNKGNIYIYLKNIVNFPICNRNKINSKFICKEIKYNGIVWCPSLPNKTWIARRNGQIFITGNSDEKGTYTAIDGNKVRKVTVNDPKEIKDLKTKDSYEADIHYCKKYSIDNIDKFDKCNIKWAMIDIEVLKGDNEFPDPMTAKFPVTSITIYNSKYDKIRNWFIGDYGSDIAKAEVLLFKDFIEYMRKAKFDLLLGYYMEDFDFPYLFTRFAKLEGIQKYLFEKESDYNNFATAISPIGKVRGGKKDYNNFYPAGTSIVDYLTWMKKIYKSEKSYSLDSIAEKYLKVGKKYKDVDFSKITEEIKLRNIDDVELMVKLEVEKFHFIPLFDEIRRFAKVNWEDFGFNSRIIDALLLQEAKEKKIVLPNGKSYEATTDEFEGAFRETFNTGALFNIGDYDLNSAYPQILQDLCLDSSNIVVEKGDNVIEVNVNDRETKEIKNTYFVKQDEKALLPSAVKKLLVKKATFKKLMEDTNPESEEFKGIELTYDGIKNIINSFWGVLGNRFFRLYDARLASMITSSIRDLLLYLKTKTEESGYKVVYVDTDSVFVEDNNQDLSDFLNRTIQQWSMERFNKKVNISISKKGNFEKILILTMCRYKGWMRTTKGLKEEIKGIQVKRKDSTIFIAKFQDTLIDKILNKESQEQIIDWIKLEIERIKTLPIEEIAFPAKLSQAPELYKTEVTNKHGKTYSKEPPIFVRALKNAPELIKRVGDNYLWVYVKSEDPKKNVLAFDDKNKSHISEIDWDKMTERNILNIIEVIFEAMQWDLSAIIPQKVKRIRKTKETLKLSTDLGTLERQESTIIVKPIEDILPKTDNLLQPIETKELKPYFETNLGKCYNGNCVDVLKQLPTDSVDLIFTSPPYNTGNVGKNKNMYTEYKDNLSDDAYYNLLKGCLTEALRVCKGVIFFNINYMSNNKHVLYRIMYEFVDYLRENIIWKKDRIQPPIGNILGKRYEYILVFTKNTKFQLNDFRHNKAINYKTEFGSWISNLIEVSIKTDQTKFAKIHRAGFPVDLPKIFIDIYTKPGDVILDPFLGLGSTALAAESLERKWIGIELMEKYCDISKDNIEFAQKEKEANNV